jgi:signal transduction histidine kinase/CheY-like chemotaxis protein
MRRPRILHLEDDRDLHGLLARALVRAGLDVELVLVDRQDAFEAALSEGGVDLILSDRTVPGYGGLAALRDLRKRDLHIPFVILSGSPASEGVEPYLAAGAAEWLLKEDLPRVAETLRRLLSAASGQARPETRLPDEAAVTLAWAVRQLTRSVSIADVVSVVPQAARLICAADGATIAFRSGDVVRYVGQDGMAALFGLDQPIGDSVSARAMREGRPVAVEGLCEGPAGRPLARPLGGLGGGLCEGPAGRPLARPLGGLGGGLCEGPAGRPLAQPLGGLGGGLIAPRPGPGPLGGEGATGSALAVPVGRGLPVAAIAVYRRLPHPPVAHELELLMALADVTGLVLERIGQGIMRLSCEEGAAERRGTSSAPEAMARLMAHDLRNPLWQIRGFAELLRDDHALALGDEGRSTLGHLLEASDDLGRIIDGLVELAEISEEPLIPRGLDLGAAARDVAAILSVGAPDRAVEWRVAEDLLAFADPALVRILLEKLLSNALRSTRARVRALVEVGATRGEDLTTFFIRDNGEGFDPAETARLFVPFQRLHPAGEQAGAGTGLAIVRRIVHRHGGEVWAEGARDAGAAFYFTLPAPR